MIQPAKVIVADPAWQFGDKLPGKGRGASSHYGCLSLPDIQAIDLPPIADDCVLFLWRVAAMQQEALDVAKAWGFTVKSEIVWNKQTVTGKKHFGMGRHVRASHEVCLLATRGRPKPLHRAQRSTFEAPVGRHSEKPEAFYQLVESTYCGPYYELFARRQRDGWVCLGLECDGTDLRGVA